MVQYGSCKIDVCICTHRRATLAATLRSVAAQSVALDGRVRAIVVDNDDLPSALELARRVCHDVGLPFIYVHGPAHNISIARNHCLTHSDAGLLAFLDDDEVAAPGWLAALIETMETACAHVVFGPVKANYPAAAPKWLARADLHSIGPVTRRDGVIQTGYTSNVLIRGEILRMAHAPRFVVELGRSGGEDTVFFRALYDVGARMAFSPAAIVFEDVPPHRQKLSYLIFRAFRMGQTHGRGLLARTRKGRLVERLQILSVAIAKVAVCMVLVAASCGSAAAWRRQLYRAALHSGVIAKLVGVPDVQLY